MNKRISVILAYVLTFFLSFSIFPVSAFASADYVSTWEELKTALENGEKDIYIRENEPLVADCDININLKDNETVRIYSTSGRDVISMDYTNYSINVSGKGSVRFENIPFTNYSNPCIVNKDSNTVNIIVSNCGFFNGDGEEIKGNYSIEKNEEPKKEIKKSEQMKLVGGVPIINDSLVSNITNSSEIGVSNSTVNYGNYGYTQYNESQYSESSNLTNLTPGFANLSNVTFMSIEAKNSYNCEETVTVNITLDDNNITGEAWLSVIPMENTTRFIEALNEAVYGPKSNNTGNATDDTYENFPEEIFLYGDKVIYPDNISNVLNFEVEHTDYIVPIEDGRGRVNISQQSKGNYCLMATFMGNEKYDSCQYMMFTEVVQYDTYLTFNTSDFYYGNNGIITYNIESQLQGMTGNVTVDIYDIDHFDYDSETHEVMNGTLVSNYSDYVTDSTGSIVTDSLCAGDYVIHAVYSGDSVFSGSDIVANVTVEKGNPNISINSNNGYLLTTDEPVDIQCYVANNVTGNVTIMLTNETISNEFDTINISDGQVVFKVDKASNLPVSPGIYNLSLIYNGDDSYNSSSVSVPFQIMDKINKTIDIGYEDIIEYGDNESIFINVSDINSYQNSYIYDINANTSVFMNIYKLGLNSSVFSGQALLDNGKANFTLPDLAAGNYSVNVDYYGNQYNYATNQSGVLRIIKAKPQLNVSAEVIPEEDFVLVNIDATDKRGRAVNGSVDVQIEGLNNNFSINASAECIEGYAQVPLESLEVDEYVVSAQFVENENYTRSDISKTNFTVSNKQEVTTAKPTEPITTKNVETTDTKKINNEKDIKGSKYSGFKLKQAKVTKKSIKISWKKVKGAKKYEIYYSECGKNNKCKKLTTTKKTVYTIKKLKKGTYYKYRIEAINANGKVISISKLAHIVTKGSNKGNAKKIKVNKKKVILKKGKTFKLKAKEIAEAKKRIKIHRKLSYESNNNKIATVTNKGVIKAKAKGKCFVYVYAQNGVSKKVKVIVK